MHAHSWDQGGGGDSIEHEVDETSFKLLKRKKKSPFSTAAWEVLRQWGTAFRILMKNYYQSLNIFYIIYLIFKKITSVHNFMIKCIPNHSPCWKVLSWEQGLCSVSNIIIIVLPVRAWMTGCPRKLWGLSWAAPPPLIPVSQEEFILLFRTPMLLILYHVSLLDYEGQKFSLTALLHPLASTGPCIW